MNNSDEYISDFLISVEKPQLINVLSYQRILRQIVCNLKYISPQKKAIMDGMGVGRPAHESHLSRIEQKHYTFEMNKQQEKNTAAIKPKRGIIKLNKNLKSCLSVLEKKQTSYEMMKRCVEILMERLIFSRNLEADAFFKIM